MNLLAAYCVVVWNGFFGIGTLATIAWLCKTAVFTSSQSSKTLILQKLIIPQITSLVVLIGGMLGMFQPTAELEIFYFRVFATFANFTILCIGLVTTLILETFSSVLGGITPIYIRRWKWFIVALYFVCNMPIITYLVLNDGVKMNADRTDLLHTIAISLVGLWAIFNITDYLLQAIYLSRKVYLMKKSGKIKELAGSFLVAVTDWVGVASYVACLVYPDTSISNALGNVTYGFISFHCAVMVVVFGQLKDLMLKPPKSTKNDKPRSNAVPKPGNTPYAVGV
ncbi:hypothetical protein HDV03_004645 [Kappamyces sp. JEL0829]|nr:hypothetical protein HDV03_004645 [Kappamyces sp. JEL0829]